MFRSKRFAGTITIAVLAVPTIYSGSVYAMSISPAAAWKQITLNSQQASNSQIAMEETVNVTSGGSHYTSQINITGTQQFKGKVIRALMKMSATNSATKQKQAFELFQYNNNIYESTATGKWQLVVHSPSPLIGQYVNQLYTNIKMNTVRGGHQFTMGTDPKELSSLVQQVLGQSVSQATVATIFKHTKSTIVATTAKISGNEKITHFTVDIDIPTSAHALQGGSSNPTVTNSVYGGGLGNDTPVDIHVQETVALTYKNVTVSVPRGLPTTK